MNVLKSKLCYITVVVFIILSNFTVFGQSDIGHVQLDSIKLLNKIKNNKKNFVIIDIRQNIDNTDNINKSLMIPEEKLFKNFNLYQDLIGKKDIILFNQDGNYNKLPNISIKNKLFVLKGGLNEWKDHNLPIISKKRLLITGGAGFIGSNLTEKLKEKYIITILDNLSTGKLSNIKNFNVTFVNNDIQNLSAVRKIVAQSNYIVHLAANVSVQKSIEEPLMSNAINIVGFLNVLESCKHFNVNKLVYASSAAVYGDNTNLPLQEDEKSLAISNYALEKSVDEQYALLYKDTINSTGLRFFNVYGKNQDPSSPYSGVISKFISAFKNDKEVNIFGDGLQSRDFIYVDDVCDAIDKSLDDSYNGILNICTNKSTNLLDIVKILENLYNKKQKVNFLPRKNGDILHSLCNNKKAKEKINFTYKTNIRDGLKKLVEIK